MIKIAIFNRKGGVGKTITTVNLAGCLDVCMNKDVLVVDCDPQNNTTTCLSVNQDNEIEKSIVDIFSGQEDIDVRIPIIQEYNKKNKHSKITLIPATKDLDSTETRDMNALKKHLTKYEKKYDYCLMDCPPDLSEATINALCAADYVIIPTFAGRDSLNGYGMVMDEINKMKQNGYNLNLKILGILMNAVDSRRSLEKYYMKVWTDEIQENVLKSFIRESADVVNSYEFGKPIHYYKPKCSVAKDYEQLAKEIVKKINFDK